MLTSWRDLTPSSTPRWCPSRTTPSSATGRPPRWSPCAARSTGCACPRSTRPPASPGCSAPRTTVAGSSRSGTRRPSPAATSTTRSCWRRPTRRPHGTAVAQETMPLNDGRADLVRRLVCTRGQGRGRARVGGPVRVRRGRAVGAAHHRRGGERRDPGDRRAGLAAAARRPAPRPDDHRHADRFTLQEGESVELALTWTRSWDAVPPRLTIADRIDSTRIAWGLWAGSCEYQGSLPRGRRALPAGPATAHRLGDRRHRRGRHDVPARGLRRRAQLGLPVLLAAGRGDDAGGAARARVPRGGDRVARLAAARGRRPLVGPADHVPRRRRAGPAGAGARPPGGLRRLAAGPGRERGRRPGAERRARRGDVRPRAGARRGAAPRPTTPGRCSATWSTTCSDGGGDPTAASGRSAASPATSRTRR